MSDLRIVLAILGGIIVLSLLLIVWGLCASAGRASEAERRSADGP